MQTFSKSTFWEKYSFTEYPVQRFLCLKSHQLHKHQISIFKKNQIEKYLKQDFKVILLCN